MDDCYEVTLGRQPVGKVQVMRQGLYYRIICHCSLSGDVICRLWVHWGDRSESLGVVVPMGNGFGLDRKIPAKHLGDGALTFTLGPKHEQKGTFIPICPEEPFAYIERLKDSFLARKNAQPGILIPDMKK